MEISDSSRHFTGQEPGRLCQRIHAEFEEMPGLKLTLAQASRLFNIEATRCERVLETLVHDGDLAMDGPCFRRRSDGRSEI